MENRESDNIEIVQPEVLKSILDMQNENLFGDFLMGSIKAFVNSPKFDITSEEAAEVLISNLEVAFENNNLGKLVRVLECLKNTASSSFGYSSYYSGLYAPKATRTPEEIQRSWLSTLAVLQHCHCYFADKLARINSRTNYLN